MSGSVADLLCFVGMVLWIMRYSGFVMWRAVVLDRSG